MPDPLLSSSGDFFPQTTQSPSFDEPPTWNPWLNSSLPPSPPPTPPLPSPRCSPSPFPSLSNPDWISLSPSSSSLSSSSSSLSSSSTSSLPSHSFTTTKPSFQHGAQKENVNFTPNGDVTPQDRVSVEIRHLEHNSPPPTEVPTELPNYLRPRQQFELNSKDIRQKNLPNFIPKILLCQLPWQITKRFRYEKEGRFNVKEDNNNKKKKEEWVDLGAYQTFDKKRTAKCCFKIGYEGEEEIKPWLVRVIKKEEGYRIEEWIPFETDDDFLNGVENNGTCTGSCQTTNICEMRTTEICKEKVGYYVVPDSVKNSNAFSFFFVFVCEIGGQRTIVLPERIILEEEIISNKQTKNQVTLNVPYLKFGRYTYKQKESPSPSLSSFPPSKRPRTTPPLTNGGGEPPSSRAYFPSSQVSSSPSPASQVHFPPSSQVHFPTPLQYPSFAPFRTPSRNPFFKMVEQGSIEDHRNLSTDFQKLFEEQKRDASFMGSRPKDYLEATIERGKKYEELLQRQTKESGGEWE